MEDVKVFILELDAYSVTGNELRKILNSGKNFGFLTQTWKIPDVAGREANGLISGETGAYIK